MKRVTNRMIRVNEEIKRELSTIVRAGIKDPRVDKLVTIIKVETTSDLKYCKAFVSCFDTSKQKETVEGLKSAEGYIRRELAKRLNLRSTPTLQFVADDSIEYSIKMSGMLNKIKPKTEEDTSEDE